MWHFQEERGNYPKSSNLEIEKEWHLTGDRKRCHHILLVFLLPLQGLLSFVHQALSCPTETTLEDYFPHFGSAHAQNASRAAPNGADNSPRQLFWVMGKAGALLLPMLTFPSWMRLPQTSKLVFPTHRCSAAAGKASQFPDLVENVSCYLVLRVHLHITKFLFFWGTPQKDFVSHGTGLLFLPGAQGLFSVFRPSTKEEAGDRISVSPFLG